MLNYDCDACMINNITKKYEYNYSNNMQSTAYQARHYRWMERVICIVHGINLVIIDGKVEKEFCNVIFNTNNLSNVLQMLHLLKILTI